MLRPLLDGPVLAVAGQPCMVLVTLSHKGKQAPLPLVATVAGEDGSALPDATIKPRDDGLYEVQLNVEKVRGVAQRDFRVHAVLLSGQSS